jgi:hypothetical protein
LPPRRGKPSRGVPRTYIACAKHTGPFKPFGQRAQTEAGWRYRELPAVHDVMITAPRDLVALLLEAA